MQERPCLDKNLEESTFRNFYYLKEELVSFCKKNQLPTFGSKEELTERIAYFLKNGKLPFEKRKKVSQRNILSLTLDTKIEKPFVCSEKHRAFFKEQIGDSFSFLVPFQKWLKNNSGKTYQEAIDAYDKILKEKKTKEKTIDKQFEYNTYIRDFFKENPGKTLEDAIRCWKCKKSLPGTNCYEKKDLEILYQSERKA
ncbi:MAG: hypothetical protein KH135_04155 [Firmicutes bacterium]|nr:hypothetical protein [Bacillota bacterium]